MSKRLFLGVALLIAVAIGAILLPPKETPRPAKTEGVTTSAATDIPSASSVLGAASPEAAATSAPPTGRGGGSARTPTVLQVLASPAQSANSTAPTTLPPKTESENCNPNYVPCVPVTPGGLTCEALGYPVTIKGEDVYNLDDDSDGAACESYAHNPAEEEEEVTPLPTITKPIDIIVEKLDATGYPWANYRADTWTHSNSCTYGDDIDPWGMCYRQSVSYAAWRTNQTKGYMPFGFGNAKDWDERARALNIAVDEIPAAGDVAVSNRGTWGHVMYVESVNPNGTINISQYNVRLTGEYSEATISVTGLVFIHF